MSERLTPTDEQYRAIELFLTGVDLVIEAGAGAAKTSTLVMCAEAAPGRIGQYVAFNKALVTEAGEKFPSSCATNTVHSLAYRAIVSRDRRFRQRLDSARRMRGSEIARILRVDRFQVTYGEQTKTIAYDRVASLAMRAVENFCQSADPEPTRRHVPYVDGIDLPAADGRRTYANNDLLAAYLEPFLRMAWRDLQSPTGSLPFKPSHYLKMWERSGPVILADFILFDEAQDASPVMLSIIEQQERVQKVVVGDSAQAIYGFTGAVNAIERWKAMDVSASQLSQSFRFGPAVADVANGLLVRLGADLRLRGTDTIPSVVGPHPSPDVVLCRTNATAVRTCLVALGEGRRPALVGGAKDVIMFAEAARDLQNGKHTNHPDLACFDTWQAVEQYVAQDEQGSDLRLMVKLVAEFGVDRIIDSLSGTVREEEADLIVSTAHKSKGREWAVVQLANDFFAPETGECAADELRLLYVAVTRAKLHLDVTLCPQALDVPGAEDAAPAEDAADLDEDTIEETSPPVAERPLAAGDVVVFTANQLGTTAEPDSTRFEPFAVSSGDKGVYVGPHPRLTEHGWHLCTVDGPDGTTLYCPVHESMFRRAS
jgi:hypothetical protein